MWSYKCRVTGPCLTIALLATCSCVGYAQQSYADITGYLENFDAWNRTGQTANDFHLELKGVLPGHINKVWYGDYPGATITLESGTTVINWFGSSTPDGGHSHFGIGLNLPADSARSYWTLDGNQLGIPLPIPNQRWDPTSGGGGGGDDGVRNTLTNGSGVGVGVQRRINSTEIPIDLSDLLVDGELWNNGTVIDVDPVFLAPGEELTYDFAWDGQEYISFVMMYDIVDQAGQPIARSLIAVNIVASNCRADFNGDGTVNTVDVLAFLNLWFTGDANADYNRDGVVNTMDVIVFLNAWNAGC